MASDKKKVVILLFAVATVMGVIGAAEIKTTRDSPSSPANSAQTNNSVDTAPNSDETGQLKVWVPGGMVGDNYWVYLDGHLVSSPPHGAVISGFLLEQYEDDAHHPNGWYKPMDDGEFVIRNGYLMKNDFTSKYFVNNLNGASTDAKGVFFPVDIRVSPGQHTIEVVYLSDERGSFPFAITPKSRATVQNGRRTDLHIGVPNDWNRSELPRAITASPSCANKPDASGIASRVRAYADDPVVQALKGNVPSGSLASQGVVVLDLPASLGGSREFDAGQITHAADQILTNYYDLDHLQSQSEIERCKNSNPEWAKSYDDMEQIIGVVQTELQFIHKLAKK